MRRMSLCAVLILGLLFPLGCGAPDDPNGGATFAPVTPTATPRPTPTPTPTRQPPTPTPTPVPWSDYRITAVELSGNVLDIWLELEDEAYALTEQVLEGLEEAGQLTPAEVKAYEIARDLLFAEMFTVEWVNTTLSATLSSGQANVSQRVHPGTADQFLLDYFIWNMGNGVDTAKVGTLSGLGQTATGSLTVAFDMATLGGEFPVSIRVLQAKALVTPLRNNNLEGTIPFEDLEVFFLGLTQAALETFEIPAEQEAEYLQSLGDALNTLENEYATVPINGGGMGVPAEGVYDAIALDNGILPY